MGIDKLPANTTALRCVDQNHEVAQIAPFSLLSRSLSSFPAIDTVDVSEIPSNHLRCKKSSGNNWIGYQPQLMIAGFLNHQQYHWSFILVRLTSVLHQSLVEKIASAAASAWSWPSRSWGRPQLCQPSRILFRWSFVSGVSPQCHLHQATLLLHLHSRLEPCSSEFYPVVPQIVFFAQLVQKTSSGGVGITSESLSMAATFVLLFKSATKKLCPISVILIDS